MNKNHKVKVDNVSLSVSKDHISSFETEESFVEWGLKAYKDLSVDKKKLSEVLKKIFKDVNTNVKKK